MIACEKDNFELVNILINYGADVNAKDNVSLFIVLYCVVFNALYSLLQLHVYTDIS